MVKSQRGLGATRSATVSISDSEGGHRGQGLLLNLGDEGTFVLTCHHVVAPLRADGIYVTNKSTPKQSEVRVSCQYDPAHSRPRKDAAVLRVTDMRPDSNPLLHTVGTGAYDGSIEVIGLTHMQPDSFNASLGPQTSLDLPVPEAGDFPDPPSNYQIKNAFRLVNITDSRPGISGGVVYSDSGGGVVGLVHFSRPLGTHVTPEGYLIPLEVWAEDWPALDKLIEPFIERSLREAAVVKPVAAINVGEEGDILIDGYVPEAYVTHPAEDTMYDAFDRFDKVFIIGRPTSGKTRLAWELMRDQEETILIIPTQKEPPANLKMPSLRNRSVILFFDDIHKKLSFDIDVWHRRLSEAIPDCKLICITRHGRDFQSVKNQEHLARLLESLEPRAFVYASRIDGQGDDFDSQLGEQLADKLGLSNVDWRSHYDYTPGSLIRLLKERRRQYPQPEAQVINTLPPRPLNIIGRDDEIKKLKTSLMDKNTRLLTVWGAGGTGKTVLTILVAEELQQAFKDGVCFIDLSKVGNSTLVASEISRTLKLKELRDNSLISFLENKQLLLVLDNFEHVITEAVLVQTILLSCPKLKILVTSQYLLGNEWLDLKKWERPFSLKPFDVAGLSALADLGPAEYHGVIKRHPAVMLFETYMKVALGDEQLELSDEECRQVAKICAMLDGLPLAIEVVASQTDSLDIAYLHEELSKFALPTMDTHGRLEKAFSLSYGRLNNKEQALFKRLAVFNGGWTRETLEGIYVEMSVSYEDVMMNLMSLIRKSLVNVEKRPGEPQRYKMLQPLLIYARGRWEKEEALALRSAYAACFLKVVKEVEPYLASPEREYWLGKLDAENSNLQATLGWCLSEKGDAAIGLEIVGRLFWFWNLRGYFTEGRRWLKAALQTADESSDTAAWAKALYADGGLAFLRAEYEEAQSRLKDSVDKFEGLGERGAVGYALIILGMVEANLNNLDKARTHGQDSVNIFRQLGDQWGLALALNDLGNIVVAQGRILSHSPAGSRQGAQMFYNEGRGYYEEGLEIWRRLNDRWGLQLTLIQLGTLAYEEEEYAAALQYYEEALQVLTLSDDKWGRAAVLRGLGSVNVAKKDFKRAAQDYLESLVLHWQLGRYQLIVECIEGIALIAVEIGQTDDAARLYGAAERMRDDSKLWDIPGHRESFNKRLSSLKSLVDADRFNKAWNAGRSWKADQVLKSVTDFIQKAHLDS